MCGQRVANVSSMWCQCNANVSSMWGQYGGKVILFLKLNLKNNS